MLLLDAFFFPLVLLVLLCIGLPWVVLRAIDRKDRSGDRASGADTREAELLDDFRTMARQLDARLANVERLMVAELESAPAKAAAKKEHD